MQKSCLKRIESVLDANKIEFQTVDRFGYQEDKIDWADVIITSGGDGTFLTAASKVPVNNKPIIGINSDPTKSVGSLCLPSQFSSNFHRVIQLLNEGRYQWVYKQRIRVTLIGDAAAEQPKDLNDIRYNIRNINSLLEQDESQDRITSISSRTSYLQDKSRGNSLFKSPELANTPVAAASTIASVHPSQTRLLGARALNEVFIGEILSARVSYYELSLDNNEMIKMKSSGLTVCTGTGSTSWYYNINKLTEQQVKSVLEIVNNVSKSSHQQQQESVVSQQTSQQKQQIPLDDTKLVSDITRQFNEKLTFSPTEPIMAYSIRDPVDSGPTMTHSHRGFVKRVEVKSRMQDACLVLDGSHFYPFNDGSYAQLELFDEDALKTIFLDPGLI